MNSEWKEYKVSDFVSFQNGFAFKSKDFSDNGKYKVIKIKELKDGKVKFFSDSAQIDIGDNADLEKYQVIKGDILFALTGDPVSKPNPLSWVGRVSLYSHDEISLLNQRVCKAVFSDNISPLFFYYYFRQEDVFFELAGKATGSASQANISTKTISDTIIKIPDIIEQHKIAYILSTIDEKIALNTAINENLEQQAQALFKAWFVDFEPFGGVMPYDWQIIEFSSFLTPKGEKSSNEAIPMYSVTDIGIYPRQEKFHKTLASKKTVFKVIHNTDLVFGMSREILNWGIMHDKEGGVSSAYNVYSVDNRINSFYLEFYIKSHSNYFRDIIRPASREGQGIDKGLLLQKELVLPSTEWLSKFDSILHSIRSQICSIKLENQHLAALRDTLLPKLMNGEIDVSAVKI